ncbi:MAG: two-component system response regulator RegA [Phenylobacterium sp.]|jgi:two-component system response regulator RegA
MKNIIIIEDDAVLAATLQRRLQRNDYNTSTADDVAKILANISDFNADIYLVDLRIGQKSGLSLIEPLRQTYPEALIIVMTGFASIATAVNAIKLGANDYLPKPLDFKLLLDTIEGRKVDALNAPEETMSPERIEWEHIQKVLADNDGNVSATARALGMYRRTLQRKLAKHPVSQ